MKRRMFLAGVAAIPFTTQQVQARSVVSYYVRRTDAAWRELLSPDEYYVMQKGGREAEGSSPLTSHSGEGTYQCRGCGLNLYGSEAKIYTGQGWPTFQKPLYPDAVRTVADRPAVHRSSEVHCRRCESHLGDIIPEPMSPTGEVHLLNGISLVFVAGSRDR